MARVEWVEHRLREWGEWQRSEGRSDVAGYPTKSCLHPDWGRPGQGALPSMKSCGSGRGALTHFHIRALSQTLQETLTRHYCSNEPVAGIALHMKTSAATVDQRIWRAHAALAHVL
jgi:hypothetical protein